MVEVIIEHTDKQGKTVAIELEDEQAGTFLSKLVTLAGTVREFREFIETNAAERRTNPVIHQSLEDYIKSMFEAYDNVDDYVKLIKSRLADNHAH